MAKNINSTWQGQPRLPDYETIKTMAPTPCEGITPMKDAVRRILRINDEQLALNRYRWYNLPIGLNSQLIERVLYYRGRGMFLYIEPLDQFAFLPYCLDGTIDFYGRYLGAKPLPFLGADELKTENGNTMEAVLTSMTRQPVYDLNLDPAITDEALTTKCVLLTDYCKQLSQTVQPRATLNEGLIDIESNIVPYVNTLLSNSTGVSGVRVNGDDEAASVAAASDTVNLAALNGKRWLAINGQLDLQELGSSASAMRVQDMLLAMESLDNIRMGTFGLENGGIFDKKAQMLEAEASVKGSGSSLVMDDGLFQRQQAADLFNSWFLAPMGVDPQFFVAVDINPTVAGLDTMDGAIGTGYTDNQQSPQSTSAPTDTNAQSTEGNE